MILFSPQIALAKGDFRFALLSSLRPICQSSFLHFFLNACRYWADLWYASKPWWVTDQFYVLFCSPYFCLSYGCWTLKIKEKFKFSILIYSPLALAEGWIEICTLCVPPSVWKKNWSFSHFYSKRLQILTWFWYASQPWWVTDQDYVLFHFVDYCQSYGHWTLKRNHWNWSFLHFLCFMHFFLKT